MIRKLFVFFAVAVSAAAIAFHVWTYQAWATIAAGPRPIDASLDLVQRQNNLLIALLAAGFVAYLFSFDTTRKRRPWPTILGMGFLAGSCAGALTRLILGAQSFILEDRPAYDTLGLVLCAVGGLLPCLMIISFEWSMRALWPGVAGFFDRRDQPSLALTANRMALLFRPGQPGMLRSVALTRFRKGARGEVVSTLKALYEAGIRDADVLEALCKNASEQNDSEAYLLHLRELHALLPEETDIREALIDELMQQRRNSEALELMEAHPVPHNEEAYERFAKVLLAEGHVEKATAVARELGEIEGIPFRRSQALLREVLSRLSEYVPALNALAAQAERTAQREQRLRWLEKSYEANPRQSDVREALLNLYRDGGQPAKVETLLEDKLHEQPNDRELIHEYASVLYQNGRAADALARVAQVEANGDVSAKLRLLEARIRFEHQEWEPARVAAEKGLAARPNSADERELQAILKRVEKAVLTTEVAQVLEEARANPTNLELQLQALEKLVAGGHSDKVVGQVDQLLTHHPDARNPVIDRLKVHAERSDVAFNILNLLSDLLASASRYDEALHIVRTMASRGMDRVATVREGSQKILRRSPHHLPTLKLLGDTYREHARLTDMIHSYSLYLAHGGEETEDMHRALADAYIALRDYENSKRFIRQLLANQQADVDLLRRAIPLALEAHEPEDAGEYLKQLEILDPKLVDLRKLKDRVAAGLGERRFAFLKRELEAGKGGPETLEQLGDIALVMQNNGDAITYFQRASRDREDPIRARRCQAKLALAYMRKRLDDLASETLRDITISLNDDPADLAVIMDILYEIGNMFMEYKLYQKAEKVFKQLCKIDAGYRDVLQKMEGLRV